MIKLLMHTPLTLCILLSWHFFAHTDGSAASLIDENTFAQEKNSSPLFRGKSFGCNQQKTQIINSFKTPYDTHITTIKNKKNNKKFIVKQDTRNPLSAHLCGVREALGSYIAHSADIPAHLVSIIPAGCNFPGKTKTEFPATLHTMAPGTMVNKVPKNVQHFKIFIHQPLKTSVSEESWGLTRAVIQSMAMHPDLARMVALDTFIANSDRHRKNYFYDQKSNRYIAIDLENSFRSNLAAYACTCVKNMINDTKEQFSQEELCALLMYKKALEHLISLHTPASLYSKLVEFSAMGNIETYVSPETITKKLQIYKENIETNYKSCKKLVRLLDKLITTHA